MRKFGTFCLLIGLIAGCVPVYKTTTYVSGRYSGPDPVAALKEGADGMNVYLYPDSVFPNKVLCVSNRLEELDIENYDLRKDSSDDKKIFLRFDRWCLDSLASLKNLTVRGFNLETIPEALSRLPALETLSLRECEIKKFQADLSGLKNLKTLDLYRTVFSDYSGKLTLPDSLKNIYMIYPDDLPSEHRFTIHQAFDGLKRNNREVTVHREGLPGIKKTARMK